MLPPSLISIRSLLKCHLYGEAMPELSKTGILFSILEILPVAGTVPGDFWGPGR